MAKPTTAAEAGVKHAILYLKGTPDYGILLGYHVPSNSKLDEVQGKPGSLEPEGDLVEAFTDADWAGDKSTELRRRHSVSSAMVFVNLLVKDSEEHCFEQLRK
eukprot:s2990_g16.t1